jgi:hypothetical protein
MLEKIAAVLALLYPDQVGLVPFSLIAIAGGIYAVARLLF